MKPAVHNRELWKRLLRFCHPKYGGDEHIYRFARSVYQYVSSDEPEPAPRQKPEHKTSGDRVEFTDIEQRYGDHEGLVQHALEVAYSIEEPFHTMLSALEDCDQAAPTDYQLQRSQEVGATFKACAFAAHVAGLSSADRMKWYKLCRSLPMSQRMCGHIIMKLQSDAAA
jgi:hypothetical protein